MRTARFLLRDARFAMRSYAKTPGLTLTLVITLAMGLGASLASFALVNTLLMRPIGVARPHELVRISALHTRSSNDLLTLTSPMRDAIREMPAFAGVCGYDTRGVSFGLSDRTWFGGLMHLDDDCFDVLGVAPFIGRLLTAEDDRTRAKVAVATYEFWQRTLGGTPDVLSRTIAVDGQPFTIVGVAEPAFRGISTAFPPSIVVPTGSLSRASSTTTFHWTEIIARRAPGVSLSQARAQIEAAWPRLIENAGVSERFKEDRQRFAASRAFVGDMRAGVDNVRASMFQQPLLLTFGLAMLMLAICGANVANLLVARALARRREQALRTALGASRGDLVRQTAIEGLLPAIAGALLAVPLAEAITTVLIDMLQASYAGLDLPSLWDRRVVVFLAIVVLGIAAATCVAQLASGGGTRRGERSLADALRASARATGGTGHGRMRRALVAAQIALTVMLVGGAGSFVRSLHQQYAMDPGIAAVDSALVASVWPVPGGFPNEIARGPHYEELRTRIEALPGVRAASFSTWIPLNGPLTSTEVARVPERPDGQTTGARWVVCDRFFEAMGIPLKAGRTFVRTHAASPRTVILSESLAARLFPTGNAIGEHVRIGVDQSTQDLIVVGVAADARLTRPQGAQIPLVYLSFWETPNAHNTPFLLVRSMNDRPEQIASAVAAAVRATGREFPNWMRTLSTQRDLTLVRERMLAGTSSAFGLIGLAIAAVGLVGILNHYVTSRRTEIGIRVAVGASRRDITRLLLREVAGLVVFGSAAGLALLFVTSRSLSSLLYGVAPGDPWLLGATLAIVAGVSLLALAWPLRRATAIDPLIALRSE